jgi:hypothetical protein
MGSLSPYRQYKNYDALNNNKNKIKYLRPPTVADGLKTISAPLIPYIIQFCG